MVFVVPKYSYKPLLLYHFQQSANSSFFLYLEGIINIHKETKLYILSVIVFALTSFKASESLLKNRNANAGHNSNTDFNRNCIDILSYRNARRLSYILETYIPVNLCV